MDVASGGIEDEEDVPRWIQGDVTDRDVPMVGHVTRRCKWTARESVESGDKLGGVHRREDLMAEAPDDCGAFRGSGGILSVCEEDEEDET